MKNPNFSKDSYAWDISDLSGARKLKTFIKGRFLWKKKDFFFFKSSLYLKARLCLECANWKQIG